MLSRKSDSVVRRSVSESFKSWWICGLLSVDQIVGEGGSLKRNEGVKDCESLKRIFVMKTWCCIL